MPELDDIFHSDISDGNLVAAKPVDASTSVPALCTDTINDNVEYTNMPPSLLGDGYPKEFMEMAERIRRGYSFLPKIRIDDVYEELSELSIKTSATPTLQTINRELEKSQAAKDRLTELDIQITQCAMYKERVVELLTDAWNKFSDEKSADKRKGDTAFRLANFYIDLVRVESAQKACKAVMLNLCSLQDTLSRRITNIQLQLKLMDIGRNAMPDFDFSNRMANADNLVSQAMGYTSPVDAVEAMNSSTTDVLNDSGEKQPEVRPPTKSISLTKDEDFF